MIFRHASFFSCILDKLLHYTRNYHVFWRLGCDVHGTRFGMFNGVGTRDQEDISVGIVWDWLDQG